MQTPVILFRTLPGEYAIEVSAARRYFSVYSSRMEIRPDMFVIGRYSVLPFYEEQERDLALAGARLINTYKQHRYVADLMNWYQDLQELTPRSWSDLSQVSIEGPFVVKGETNSRKFQWDTHMFAKDKRTAAEIRVELQNDSLISSQGVIIREYVPLKTYGVGIHGLPITKEFRFFVAYGQVLCGGYYWSSHVADIPEVPCVAEVPRSFLSEVVRRIGNRVNFYTVDVAQTEKGNWIVIELNDGQMSGLSENDPETLYYNLAKVV
jgi:hypothetical protein